MSEELVGKQFMLEDGSMYEVTRVDKGKAYGFCTNWEEGYANECCQFVDETVFV